MHFATENLSDPVAALSCYAAALHFANGNNFLQSVIHGRRASVYNELREYQECDNDVRKCKMYDPETAVVRFAVTVCVNSNL